MAQKEKRGLGAGLDALFAANGYEEEDSIEQTTLPIGKVEPRADQPRVSFDEEQLQELADSITQYGIIQPITVRKLDSGYYQIIAGERRWRAARMAGQTEIPVRIIEADDKLTAELALVENLQRSDLNPIEEAKGYQSLMRDYGLTQEETAHSVGRSRPAKCDTAVESVSGSIEAGRGRQDQRRPCARTAAARKGRGAAESSRGSHTKCPQRAKNRSPCGKAAERTAQTAAGRDRQYPRRLRCRGIYPALKGLGAKGAADRRQKNRQN